jgi:hypothetical protein
MSVHGSRALEDERVKIILLEEIKKNGVTEIVTHAEPEGVCGITRKLCREIAMPLKLHFLNFKYLRGAFEHRSKAVLLDADIALFIHDGTSKGTSNELKLAEKMKIKSIFYELKPSEHKTSVGFEIENEWKWEDGN